MYIYVFVYIVIYIYICLSDIFEDFETLFFISSCFVLPAAVLTDSGEQFRLYLFLLTIAGVIGWTM